MFTGHYGPSFAANAAEKRLPLWLLFIAVQFVDILWAIFVLLGIEKVRIVPGITASSPLPPLPQEFQGQSLKVRLRFSYTQGGN